MRPFLIVYAVFFGHSLQADTINHYMNIANNIPKLEMKADKQAQAWARSARNVLLITSETIAETLMQANDVASKSRQPFFCLPQNETLNGKTMDQMIQKTYQDLLKQYGSVDKYTVSMVAWIGVTTSYPCNGQGDKVAKMEHMKALFGVS